MGPKGALMIMNRLGALARRLTMLDVSGNGMGPIACIPIGKALEDSECTLRTLYIKHNDLLDQGAKFIVTGMKVNTSLTDVDLSNNCLSEVISEQLADVARGLFIEGKKICDCQLKRLNINDNPLIGQKGAKALARAMTSPNFTHVEMANIGAGPGTAKIIASAIRDVALRWVYCDISGNKLARSGLNEIFWAIRQNRSLRIFYAATTKQALFSDLIMMLC